MKLLHLTLFSAVIHPCLTLPDDSLANQSYFFHGKSVEKNLAVNKLFDIASSVSQTPNLFVSYDTVLQNNTRFLQSGALESFDRESCQLQMCPLTSRCQTHKLGRRIHWTPVSSVYKSPEKKNGSLLPKGIPQAPVGNGFNLGTKGLVIFHRRMAFVSLNRLTLRLCLRLAQPVRLLSWQVGLT